MSELIPYATQGFTWTDLASEIDAVDVQGTDARTFWGNIAAHQGTFAGVDTMITSALVEGNSFFDCCTAVAVTVGDQATFNECPSAVAIAYDATGGGAHAVDYATTTALSNRIGFTKTGFSVLFESAAGAVGDLGFEWNSDFLLASQAQLNSVDDSTWGYCSGTWRTVMTSDSAMDLSATEGFNSNTKCTW